MNARLPLRAIPSAADGLPPYETDTVRFQVTVEGVALDTLIHYGDDFDLSVAAIWHRGVDIAPLLQDGIEETILNAYDVHRTAMRADAQVERRSGFSD
ncbi:hypothetical protein [Comamonas terrigena]|uniref:hypothetical protein n=1 Tax=Comamonas terrigena TaxID=32013 RepID=UPI002357D94C|nr:hypothetical protein [Comamonas terrigena]